jgi:hypothetical protein
MYTRRYFITKHSTGRKNVLKNLKIDLCLTTPIFLGWDTESEAVQKNA